MDLILTWYLIKPGLIPQALWKIGGSMDKQLKRLDIRGEKHKPKLLTL